MRQTRHFAPPPPQISDRGGKNIRPPAVQKLWGRAELFGDFLLFRVCIHAHDNRRARKFCALQTFNPTPPKPNTTTESPGRTRPAFIAAPMPVITAQPIADAEMLLMAFVLQRNASVCGNDRMTGKRRQAGIVINFLSVFCRACAFRRRATRRLQNNGWRLRTTPDDRECSRNNRRIPASTTK